MNKEMNNENNSLLSVEQSESLKNFYANADHLEVNNKDEDKLDNNEINQKDVSIYFNKNLRISVTLVKLVTVIK